MIFAIIIGFCTGAYVAYLVSRSLVLRLSLRMARDDHQRRYMRSVATVFGAISLAPSIFFTVMAGAVVNSRRAAVDFEALGLTGAITPVILSLALVVVITIVVSGAATVGALFGYLAARK